MQHPFRKDTRTEEEKILHEVEYILWMLSSRQEEANYSAETDEESALCCEEGVDSHVEDEHFIDCTKRVEDDKPCIYSLEKLISFHSLHKLCDNIEKLR